jgi:hypothetical protein
LWAEGKFSDTSDDANTRISYEAYSGRTATTKSLAASPAPT